MSFRARLTLTLLALATLPVLALGLGVRSEMRALVEREVARRQQAVASDAGMRLLEDHQATGRRLASLAAALSEDNRFRIALVDQRSAERRWLLGWAASMMPQTGFGVLLLQDSAGRILSSGHFRNDFDRVAPSVAAPRPQSPAIMDARTPAGALRARISTHTFRVHGSLFALTGGPTLDSAAVASLSTDGTVTARLLPLEVGLPEGAVGVDTLAYLDDAGDGSSGYLQLVLTSDVDITAALRAGVTRWLVIVLLVTLLVTIALAMLLGRLVSAPIVSLSERTARLDLDRLDQRFSSDRTDELGALERMLDSLTSRLRTSAGRLREAERAAATGDLARQVNHDIKNGLAPIRNVLRHLAQVAEREPATLAPVFLERRGTLESSVEYLDALARNYARLSPALSHGPTDARPVVIEVARGVTSVKVDVRLPADLPPVRADAVVLHRILDNLVANAVEALEGKPGSVSLSADAVGAGEEQRVRFTVADTGRGMTRDELNRAFDDFHTTKPAGTGLGLSVVRRLLTDVGGSVRAGTAPGEGTTFTVEIPAARFTA